MASIDKLKYNFDTGARANMFSAFINCPKLGFKLEGLRVETCSLPGRKIETQAWSEYGMTRNLPTGVVTDDGGELTMTFMCDTSFADRFFLEAWQSRIFGGEGDVDTGNSIHPIFKYYYDYVGTLTINALRKDDKTSLEYTIHEAYPVSFEKMEFSSESGDILKFSVTFNFRTWESKYVPAPKLSALNKGRRVLDALQDGLKVGSRFNRKSKDFLDKVNKLDGTATRLQTLLGGNG
jgi:hypothetical protein|tara:strand:- start:4806 stop:5513 length:708 start_codon:yes stop_codon:yes gene_type:complete